MAPSGSSEREHRYLQRTEPRSPIVAEDGLVGRTRTLREQVVEQPSLDVGEIPWRIPVLEPATPGVEQIRAVLGGPHLHARKAAQPTGALRGVEAGQGDQPDARDPPGRAMTRLDRLERGDMCSSTSGRPAPAPLTPSAPMPRSRACICP